MPITRARKSDLIDAYKARLAACSAVVVAEYSGLTVAQMQKLRRSLDQNDASFVIAKKTLMSRALNEMGWQAPEEALVGPVGFTFLGEDLAAGAKVLKDFSREVGEAFTVRGGVLGQSLMDAAGAISLADLPTRDVMLAQLVGALAAPMSVLASLITGPQRDLAGLLQARIDKEGGPAEAPAEAAA